MREIRSYGSVRGALGNQSPYRDWHSCTDTIATRNAQAPDTCPPR
jgi:hypothetical protein